MLNKTQISSLAKIVPPPYSFTDSASLSAYEIDGSVFRGRPDAVTLPASLEDVRRLAVWSQENKIPLIGRGSGTGLTGGSVAANGGVVVSFTRMHRILAVDADAMQVSVEPGVVTQRLQNQLSAHALYYPPDPASYAVCSIGGNIAENAGGPHCLKYGITRHYVQALQVVLAGGEILWLGSPVVDPPEYDFVSLFTGSEGTLGLLTSAVLRLRPQPKSVKALTASFSSIESAGKAVSAVISAGLLPATIELLDHFMIRIVEEYLHAGFPTQAEAMLILDVDGYPQSLDAQLEEIAQILQRFNPIEIKLARTALERDAIWLGRRSSAGALSRLSPSHYGVDVCVPRTRFAEALVKIKQLGAEHDLPIGFIAHAGDGNMHPMIICDLEDAEMAQRVHHLSDEILKEVAAIGGTIGGEHGTGLEKRDGLKYMYNHDEISAMLQAKAVFDPDGLMNPGLIFPDNLPPSNAQTLPAAPLVLQQFAPLTPIEAAAALYQLQQDHRQVNVAGAASQWRGDTPGLLLSTVGLQHISAINTDDFYIHTQPGVRLTDLHSALEEKGFWLPAYSPWNGTIGGLVASGLGCPLRHLYGWLRDLVLSVQIALPDGRLVRFGRPLVKDVAGYDMARLFNGSYGTLGMITDLHLKIVAIPKARRSILVNAGDLSQALMLARKFRAAASLSAGMQLLPAQLPVWQVALTLEGHPADVAAEMDIIRGLLADTPAIIELESNEPLALHAWQSALRHAYVAARLSVHPLKLADVPERLDHNSLDRLALIDYPSGTAYFNLPESQDSVGLEPAATLLGALQRAATSLGGHATWLAGPRAWLPQVEAWGAPRQVTPYMRGLKERWDPANILNRGEFVV